MVIDSHLHIWQRSEGRYSWLTPDLGEIYDDFTADRAGQELKVAGVDGAILVQAEDSENDSEYMFEAAARYPWVRGVVAWVSLEFPDQAEGLLSRWLAEETFCGVRQLVHDDLRDNVYLMPSVQQTVRLLAAHGLPLDIPDAWPRDLPQVVELAGAIPELTLVLDHFGKPPVEKDELALWRKSCEALAQRENTVIKFSGLHRHDRPFTPADVGHLWDLSLELFGPSRMMVGSDWPISVAYGGYQPTWETIQELVSSLSHDEQREVSSGTASRVYGRSSRLVVK